MSRFIPISCHKKNNALYMGDVNLCDLVGDYGSPVYVLDKKDIVQQCQAYTNALAKLYPNSLITYASKANLNIGLAKLLLEQGFGFDVVSGGELYTVLHTAVPRDNIYLHGTSKSDEEILMAIENHVRLIVDNETELGHIVRLTKEHQLEATLMLRLKPEIDTKTHAYVQTGQLDSQFGIDLSQLGSVLATIQANPQLHFIGIHSHLGSQLFEPEPYAMLGKRMVDLLKLIQEKHGLICQEVNFGGGMGVSYQGTDDPPQIEALLSGMLTPFKEGLDALNYPHPKVLLEPGRSIVAVAGVSLYAVRAVKPIPGIKTYLVVDGGMADNPRHALYQSQHSMAIANKIDAANTHTYDIAGRYCESGDRLGTKIALPETEPGDVLAIYGTGAYTFSMASNYNRHPRPALLMIENDQIEVLVKRETLDDIIKNDV